MPMRTREAQREYQREWLLARRRKWLEENGPCVQCGSSENLELDHVDPTKKVSHRVWSWSKDRRNEELSKCQVLCQDCHLIKTKRQLSRLQCLKGHSLHDADRKTDGSVNRCRTCRLEAQRQRDRRRV